MRFFHIIILGLWCVLGHAEFCKLYVTGEPARSFSWETVRACVQARRAEYILQLRRDFILGGPGSTVLSTETCFEAAPAALAHSLFSGDLVVALEEGGRCSQGEEAKSLFRQYGLWLTELLVEAQVTRADHEINDSFLFVRNEKATFNSAPFFHYDDEFVVATIAWLGTGTLDSGRHPAPRGATYLISGLERGDDIATLHAASEENENRLGAVYRFSQAGRDRSTVNIKR